MVPRIKDEFLMDFGGEEIFNLVKDYYKMFDSTQQASGGIQLNVYEIKSIKEHLNNKRFNNICEIGVCDGGSLWIYANLFCKEGANITAIDPKETECAELVMNNLRNIFQVHYYENKCCDVKDLFPDKFFDLIHIDGEHHYSAVKEDFDAYKDKLADDGIIIFHDSNSAPGVREFIDREVVKWFDCIDFRGIGYIASSSAYGLDDIITGTTIARRKQ